MTILLFILILAIVVLIHELGHFLAAKRSGVKVEEFGFGFPPKLFGFKPKGSETEYTLNLIPLGGFVRLHGEDGKDIDNPRSFAAKSFWQKTFIIVSGVVMNFLLAIVCFTLVSKIGFPQGIEDSEVNNSAYAQKQVIFTSVSKNSPAQELGLKPFDAITKINETPITTSEQLRSQIKEFKGQSVSIEVKRGQEIFKKDVTIRETAPEGEGLLGIGGLSLSGIKSVSWLEAIKYGLFATYTTVYLILFSLWTLISSVFTRAPLPEGVELSGPVGIVQIVGDFSKLGIAYLLLLVANISASLGIFNILPIPALDGGRQFFLIIEKVTGKKVKEEVENAIHTAGFVLLIGLMVLVTVRDILKLRG